MVIFNAHMSFRDQNELLAETIFLIATLCDVKVGELADEIAIERLSKRLGLLTDEQGANAAVAVILTLEDSEFSILFVKRVESLADPWSGQIGLPGGKREPEDRNLQQNVVRETFEETGIDLLNNHFLGLLPAMRSTPRPELMILPFVIFLEHKPIIKLNRKELESFTWIPLQRIRKSKNTVRIGSKEVPAYVVGKTVIWGLTYRILESFFQIINGGPDNHAQC
jgi:8-oxo-dGTP pyrophosphatase MutT (NUDIX family)